MEEVWKQVPGFSKYMVSNQGRVKSFAQNKVHGRIIKPTWISGGYLSVKLSDDNCVSHERLVHRLVAMAFIDNPNNYPQVNHKNENKRDNRVDNLEWCDNKYNANYGTRSERIAKANTGNPLRFAPVFSIDFDGNFAFYSSVKEAAEKNGLFPSNIIRTINGRSHTCGKRYWFYSCKPPLYEARHAQPTTTEREDTEQSVMQQSDHTL